MSEVELREPMMTIAVGMKGIGKTYRTKTIIESYARGNPALGIKPRRVLIFDVNNEFTYPTINLKDVEKFSYHPKIEIRRATMFKPDGEKMNLDDMKKVLHYILGHFSNGLLLIEDISRYVPDSLDRGIIGSIVTQRHVNCDIIIHFQTKGKAGHPKLVGNMNWLRVHETTDSFDYHKNKFEGHMTPLKLAECLVKLMNDRNAKTKRWFYCYIGMQIHEIKGEFTKNDFKEAIQMYISQNSSETLKPLLKEVDRKGKKLFTPETAFNELEKRYMGYYGNAS